MKLYTTCKECNSEILLQSKFPTRWELSGALGKEINLTCPKCKATNKCHVERIYAKTSKWIGLINLLLILCAVVILWYVYPYAIKGILTLFIFPVSLLVPVMIHFVLVGMEKQRVNTFNSSHPESLKTYNFRK